ncbi:EAL domain-containing protein [Photobacterium sagamiensis]
MRWHSKSLGFVSPLEFIPVAESIGLINDLGIFVLEESLKTYLELAQNNIKLDYVAVNISPIQLLDGLFVFKLKALLSKYQFNSKNLKLELTESAFNHEFSSVVESIKEIKTLGVKIAIDDFGTGESSLLRLKQFKTDCLKIDKSFVSEMLSDHQSMNIVSTIIGLANNMDMFTVAEGVENQEQAISLIKNGADFLQGYYYSKPIPKQELIEFFISKNTTRNDISLQKVIDSSRVTGW